MVDVFVLRSLESMTASGMKPQDSQEIESCLQLHGVSSQRSYLALDGSQMLCHFRTPDAESVRMALRGARIKYEEVWVVRTKETSNTTWRESHD
jgi:hypothetical protein